jgi:hypothetical protein
MRTRRLNMSNRAISKAIFKDCSNRWHVYSSKKIKIYAFMMKTGDAQSYLPQLHSGVRLPEISVFGLLTLHN